MAVTKDKRTVEVLLVSAEIRGGLQKLLLKSRNLINVDLVWPRVGVPKKSASREAWFEKSRCDFVREDWTKRVLFREEVEGHAGLAVTISENLTDEWIEKFLRLVAKNAFKVTADMVEKYTTGVSDVAAAPFDALSAIVGTYPGPRTILEGVCDIAELPEPGQEIVVEATLRRPRARTACGKVRFLVRG